MNNRIRRLLHAYVTRRSPWGPPWWIYGVSYGAVNLVRQAVIIASPSEIPQSIRVLSWAATALLVIAVVNGVAAVLRRGRDRGSDQHDRQLDASRADARRTDDREKRATTSTRWAPWWVYLVIIIGANYLRRAVLPDGSTPALRVVLALAVSAILFVVITIAYRGSVRGSLRRGAEARR
jgi:hypothetical protein